MPSEDISASDLVNSEMAFAICSHMPSLALLHFSLILYPQILSELVN